jgi:predicted ATP-grasp superfamily ATP-dependent carboligase
MDTTYGSNEFWTNANRQEMMELGLASQHEGEDFYTSLLQQGEEMKRLQKQLKKQGEDVSKPALTTSEMNTLPSDGTYSRKLILLPEHAKIERKTKKGNTDRLWKAMGLPAPKSTKRERDSAPAENIALSKLA